MTDLSCFPQGGIPHCYHLPPSSKAHPAFHFPCDHLRLRYLLGMEPIGSAGKMHTPIMRSSIIQFFCHLKIRLSRTLLFPVSRSAVAHRYVSSIGSYHNRQDRGTSKQTIRGKGIKKWAASHRCTLVDSSTPSQRKRSAGRVSDRLRSRASQRRATRSAQCFEHEPMSRSRIFDMDRRAHSIQW